MKKDIKKSSYYVWFLGAQECKNVRDVESIIPVISTLAEREKKVTPYKFTLQVSHRGLKIVHNVSALISLPGGKSSKSDLVKHLIPDHAVTCVHQDEDLVAVILLLYNPVTKWPVHVHVYRCDTVETATLLSTQLRMLVDRPENKKKLNDIESRLQTKSETHCNVRNDRKKESPPQPPLSPESGVPGPGHVTTLYDSLAAELKKKLGTGGKTGGVPILLPPRDYDTVHRHRGNLNGIDFRRCMSANIVGVNSTGARPQQDFRRSGTKMGSSGGSSGIGSDHAPSPEQYEPENAYADNNSSSDDDWNASPLEEPLFAKPTNDHPLPRIRRQDSGVDSSSSPVTSPEKDYYNGRQELQHHNNVTNFKRQNFGNNNNNISPNLREKYSDRNVALVQPRPRNCDAAKNSAQTPLTVPEHRKKPVEIRQRTPSPNRPTVRESPRERFKDAKEKFLMLEKERIDEQQSELKKRLERQRKENAMPMIRAAVRESCNWSRNHHSDDDEMDRNRYDDDGDYNDDHFGHQMVKNYRRTNQPRERLDTDYNSGYSKPISNRQSRKYQHDHDESRLVPRSYSAEDFPQSDHNYRPPPPDDRHKNSPRRAAIPEAPRAAPRRNRYNDVSPPPPELSSRANDYKRRSAAYAYEDDGGCCPPTSYGGRPRGGEPDIREADDDDDDDDDCDDDGLPPTASVGREYKRRSAVYAYEEHHPHHNQHPNKHHRQNHHQQQHDLGGSGYGGSRREAMSDKRAAQAAAEDSPSPISPRYRHSYAEAYHRHQHQQAQAPQESAMYRHNGSLQSSGRIGIAAIHPY
ncbi:LIM domain-containing protein A [Rhopalosiphum maidis]|uniref:LIM domain-containing protein A n=1 Tax=Rhopalosiphum maidis TaxID=43146 RepID=UPI000EFFFE5C|nr:LIM domain-containing protein A [Rhopalosiphum maidis]